MLKTLFVFLSFLLVASVAGEPIIWLETTTRPSTTLEPKTTTQLIVNQSQTSNVGKHCGENEVVQKIAVYMNKTVEIECSKIPCGTSGQGICYTHSSCNAPGFVFTGLGFDSEKNRLLPRCCSIQAQSLEYVGSNVVHFGAYYSVPRSSVYDASVGRGFNFISRVDVLDHGLSIWVQQIKCSTEAVAGEVQYDGKVLSLEAIPNTVLPRHHLEGFWPDVMCDEPDTSKILTRIALPQKGNVVFVFDSQEQMWRIKEEIMKEFGVPVDQQKLTINGRQPSASSTLSDYLTKGQNNVTINALFYKKYFTIDETGKMETLLIDSKTPTINDIHQKSRHGFNRWNDNSIYYNGKKLNRTGTLEQLNVPEKAILLVRSDRIKFTVIDDVTHKQEEITMSPGDYMSSLKNKIEKTMTIPMALRALKYNGNTLDTSCCDYIREHNFPENPVVHVALMDASEIARNLPRYW